MPQYGMARTLARIANEIADERPSINLIEAEVNQSIHEAMVESTIAVITQQEKSDRTHFRGVPSSPLIDMNPANASGPFADAVSKGISPLSEGNQYNVIRPTIAESDDDGAIATQQRTKALMSALRSPHKKWRDLASAELLRNASLRMTGSNTSVAVLAAQTPFSGTDFEDVVRSVEPNQRGYAPKGSDESGFVRMHKTNVHADRAGNDDTLFKGATKPYPRRKNRYRYDVGADHEAEYAPDRSRHRLNRPGRKPEVAREESDEDEYFQRLISGEVEIPASTYFSIGRRELPETVKMLIGHGGQVCENLYFLGKSSDE